MVAGPSPLTPWLDVEAAGGGAGEAVGTVHVLYRCRRVHERAGSHRAHEIGDRGGTHGIAALLVAVGVATAAPPVA